MDLRPLMPKARNLSSPAKDPNDSLVPVMRALDYPPDRYAIAPIPADALIMLFPFWPQPTPANRPRNEETAAEGECHALMSSAECPLAFIMSLKHGCDPLSQASPHPHDLRYLNAAADGRAYMLDFPVYGVADDGDNHCAGFVVAKVDLELARELIAAVCGRPSHHLN